MTVKTHDLPGPQTIARTTLDNGITVLVYENHASPSVVVSGSLHTGSLYARPEQSGIAVLTANALMRGTENRDFEAIYGSLENIGADLDFNTRVHKTGFGGKALAEDLPVLVGRRAGGRVAESNIPPPTSRAFARRGPDLAALRPA